MGFFKTKEGKADFNLFASFSYMVPGWGQLLILAALFFVGIFLGSALLLAVMFCMSIGSGAEISDVNAALGSYGTLMSYIVMFVPAFIYANVRGRRNAPFDSGVAMDSRHFGRFGFVSLALMCAIGTLAAGFVMDPVTRLLPEMDPDVKAALDRVTGEDDLFANVLCVCIMAPLFEEWFCRGMLLRGLLKMGHGRLHPALAIPLSALLFGLIHGNIWQGLPAFAIGCLFGYVYWRTGSLKLTMIMHCVNNTFSLALNQVDSLKDMDSWAQVLPAGQYWGVAVLSLAIVGILILALSKIPMADRSGNLDFVAPLGYSQEY